MPEDKYYCKEDEIDIYELWLVLKKRIKSIISFFFMCDDFDVGYFMSCAFHI